MSDSDGTSGCENQLSAEIKDKLYPEEVSGSDETTGCENQLSEIKDKLNPEEVDGSELGRISPIPLQGNEKDGTTGCENQLSNEIKDKLYLEEVNGSEGGVEDRELLVQEAPTVASDHSRARLTEPCMNVSVTLQPGDGIVIIAGDTARWLRTQVDDLNCNRTSWVNMAENLYNEKEQLLSEKAKLLYEKAELMKALHLAQCYNEVYKVALEKARRKHPQG